MTAKIAAVKAGYMAPTRENVEQLIAGINSLKETDKSEYTRIKEQLQEKLFADAVGKLKENTTIRVLKEGSRSWQMRVGCST